MVSKIFSPFSFLRILNISSAHQSSILYLKLSCSKDAQNYPLSITKNTTKIQLSRAVPNEVMKTVSVLIVIADTAWDCPKQFPLIPSRFSPGDDQFRAGLVLLGLQTSILDLAGCPVTTGPSPQFTQCPNLPVPQCPSVPVPQSPSPQVLQPHQEV